MERTWRAYPDKSAGDVARELRLQRQRELLEKHLRWQRELPALQSRECAELQPWMEMARRGVL